MSTIPTLPTVPAFAPPQLDPYFGFGGVQYEIALSSPILQEDTPPPIIIRAHSPIRMGSGRPKAPISSMSCAK